MKVVYKSATQARKEFFALIQAAVQHGQETVVTQRGKPVVRIKADEPKQIDWKEYDRVVKELRALLTEEDYRAMQKAHDTFQVRDKLW